MQKLRHKPFNFARCAGRRLSEPLEPFSYDTVNVDPVTKANALPAQVFDTKKFHYHYDNYKVGISIHRIHGNNRTLVKRISRLLIV